VGSAQEGAHLNVVFMDNDILVFKSLARIFDAEDFDYGCTISDSPEMPVRVPDKAAELRPFVCKHQARNCLTAILSAVVLHVPVRFS
jgi:alpha-N-acetylglucosamine transferase